ncbi:MOSC domain-containing protein [Pseudoxanthomonas daejeonensis]|uniref:MOSC domain-containing protein n=1 Tax=Pseudoxanthomonas daejeonensis TaxID=266062 RepID=UPI001F540872|nr:MOSC domain-containing protein [Pseudoxanthomonas daejeonensis]UNK57185.1 MOSC domain-containing protein [Pseudoxanthomonas daejeonensis]
MASRAPCRIDAVLVGRAVDYTRPGSRSAIDKHPLAGPVGVGLEGLAGDEQGDRRVHGGPDKAIHHYPRDHYATWQGEVGAHPLLMAPGAFGENISTTGITEADVCLGDRLRLGTALVEVSQARQPCWKLSDRFGIADMARRVQDTGRCGWYYRVLEPGIVQASDVLALVERPHVDWALPRLSELLYRRTLDRDELRGALALPLVPSWRRLFERRLEQGDTESWESRLHGPGASP